MSSFSRVKRSLLRCLNFNQNEFNNDVLKLVLLLDIIMYIYLCYFMINFDISDGSNWLLRVQ